MKNLDYELAKKLDKEFNMYKKNLREKSKDEIIKNAYQLIVKEEIKEELKYMDLYDEEKKILICKDIIDSKIGKRENILDYLILVLEEAIE